MVDVLPRRENPDLDRLVELVTVSGLAPHSKKKVSVLRKCTFGDDTFDIGDDCGRNEELHGMVGEQGQRDKTRCGVAGVEDVDERESDGQ